MLLSESRIRTFKFKDKQSGEKRHKLKNQVAHEQDV